MEVTPCLWIGTLNIVQMVVLSQMANRPDSMKSLLKFQLLFFFFCRNGKCILRFIQSCKGPRVAKTVLKKKNKVGRLIPPYFKTYCKTIVINTV